MLKEGTISGFRKHYAISLPSFVWSHIHVQIYLESLHKYKNSTTDLAEGIDEKLPYAFWFTHFKSSLCDWVLHILAGGACSHTMGWNRKEYVCSHISFSGKRYLSCIGECKADRLRKLRNQRNIQIWGDRVKRQEGNCDKHFTAVCRKWPQNNRISFTLSSEGYNYHGL